MDLPLMMPSSCRHLDGEVEKDSLVRLTSTATPTSHSRCKSVRLPSGLCYTQTTLLCQGQLRETMEQVWNVTLAAMGQNVHLYLFAWLHTVTEKPKMPKVFLVEQ